MYLRGADSTPVGMVFNERVMDYTVTTLRNDVVDYRRVLRLTTVSGQRLFLAFPDVPPADWLQFPDSTDTNVFLPAADFDATYRVLRDESPVFVTGCNSHWAACLQPRLRRRGPGAAGCRPTGPRGADGPGPRQRGRR